MTHYKDTEKKAPEVDLYIPSIDTAIQLDPYWSHRNRAVQDRKTHLIQTNIYTKIYRFREEPLNIFTEENIYILPKKQSSFDWAKYIALTIKPNCELSITKSDIEHAYLRPSTAWATSFVNKKDNLTSQSFYKEFIKNVSHPGKPS